MERKDLYDAYRAKFGRRFISVGSGFGIGKPADTVESPPQSTPITERQIEQYKRHGIAVIPLSAEALITETYVHDPSNILVDLSFFPEARYAYLKGLSPAGCRLIISSGKQEHRQKHKPDEFVELAPGVQGLRVRMLDNQNPNIPHPDAELETF